MPARTGERLSQSSSEYRDRQLEERRRLLAALLAELERARHHAEPWYRWVEWRHRGEHRHDLRDEQGRAIACPVAGCAAVRGSQNPHLAQRARAARA